MRKVVVHVRKGPLAGTELQLELGHVVLGREPGPGGILLPEDRRISRRHGELFEEDGQLVYRNLSPNGTRIDGAWVTEQQVLSPGAELHLGERTHLELRFEASQSAAALTEVVGQGTEPLHRGPLGRPLVRALLAAYLLGLAALAVVLQNRSSESGDFEPVRKEYALYRPAGTPEAVLEDRRLRAETLVRELAALERRESWPRARATCRELMALDGDPESPIYRFAARRLGEIADRGVDEP